MVSLLKDKNINNTNISDYDCGVCFKCLTEQPKTPTDDSIHVVFAKNGIMYHVLITLQKINLIARNFLGFALYV